MQSMPADLNKRAREVLRLIVDAYVETGEPVGSRAISRRLGMSLSPATIRNVMADLEDIGLLHAPHTSAGRLPTEAVHSTCVSPNFARQEPSAYLETPVSRRMSRSWSKARPDGRSVIMALWEVRVGATLPIAALPVQSTLKTGTRAISFSGQTG